MMNRLTALLTALVCAVLFLTAGCVRKEVEPSRLAFGKREKKNYEPIRSPRLKLELTGTGQLFAGDGGILTFALVNEGKKKIVIEEWFSNEGDNIVIYCQNWLPGMVNYDPQGWIKLEFEPRKPAWRYPLHLAAGNRMFIAKKLPFVDQLSITPGSERRYFIKAELNLTSVKLASKVSTVSVRNPADKRRKEPQREQSRHFGR